MQQQKKNKMIYDSLFVVYCASIFMLFFIYGCNYAHFKWTLFFNPKTKRQGWIVAGVVLFSILDIACVSAVNAWALRSTWLTTFYGVHICYFVMHWFLIWMLVPQNYTSVKWTMLWASILQTLGLIGVSRIDFDTETHRRTAIFLQVVVWLWVLLGQLGAYTRWWMPDGSRLPTKAPPKQPPIEIDSE